MREIATARRQASLVWFAAGIRPRRTKENWAGWRTTPHTTGRIAARAGPVQHHFGDRELPFEALAARFEIDRAGQAILLGGKRVAGGMGFNHARQRARARRFGRGSWSGERADRFGHNILREGRVRPEGGRGGECDAGPAKARARNVRIMRTASFAVQHPPREVQSLAVQFRCAVLLWPPARKLSATPALEISEQVLARLG